jgi:hypothetical protein
MLACIIGNVYSGLMIMALQSKLNHTDNEAVAGIWILWKTTYRLLHHHSAVAMGAAGRLYGLHRRLKLKYPDAFMLNPIKIYSKTNRPKMTKMLTPLIKVFNKSAMSKYDDQVLKRSDYLKKLKLYIKMKQSLYQLKQVVRTKRIEDSQTQILHNLRYQQALGYNDLSIKINQVSNIHTLRKYRNFRRESRTLLEKARGALKISEKLLKVKTQPNFKVSSQVQAITLKIIKNVSAAINLANYKDEVEQISESSMAIKQLSLAEKLKIKKQIKQLKKSESSIENAKQKVLLREAKERTDNKESEQKETGKEIREEEDYILDTPALKHEEVRTRISKPKATTTKDTPHPLHSLFELVPLEPELELKSVMSSDRSKEIMDEDLYYDDAAMNKKRRNSDFEAKIRKNSVYEPESSPTNRVPTLRRTTHFSDEELHDSNSNPSLMFNSQVNRHLGHSSAHISSKVSLEPFNSNQRQVEFMSRPGNRPQQVHSLEELPPASTLLGVSKGDIAKKLKLLRKRLSRS